MNLKINVQFDFRMPFPDLRDVDKAEKAKALKEMTRRQNLSAGKVLKVMELHIYFTNFL